MTISENAWTGRLVVRLLPQSVNGDYEVAKLSNNRRVQPPPFSAIDPVDDLATRTPFNPAWVNDWKLKDCACVTLDIFATDGSNHELAIHMNRSPTETVDKALQRLGLSLCKKLFKKQKGGKKTPDVKYSLRRGDGTNLDGSRETHAQLWTQAFGEELEVHMSIEDVRIHLQVECCPPTLVSIKTYEKFGARVFVGIPLVVTVESVFSSQTMVDWYVNGERVHHGTVSYTPTAAHVGKPVLVVVTPARRDCKNSPESYQFEHVVEERPRNAILELRPNFFQPRESDNNLRVLSYNILADLNAFSVGAQTSVYPYCDADIIRKERRLPLILFEILQYQADVICLQEVDYGVYYGLLQPVLKSHGYTGFFTSKQGTREGGAMFWSLKVFEPLPDIERKSHVIGDLFEKDQCLGDWGSMQDVLQLLDRYPELNQMLRERLGHVLQTATLTRRDDQRKVVVGNTHLFFHPMASHVRLLQLYVCLRQMQVERQGQFPVVLCGDLNSSPTSGAARLVFDRVVLPTSGLTDQGTTWKHLHTFSWDREYKDPSKILKDAPEPPTIRLPDSFPALCSAYPDLPTYTHYKQNFAATLDYILISQDSLKPVVWAEMPSEEILTKNVAMPSEVLPSDHVCLVCDLKWISN